MKPLQIGLLVLVGALGGALIMKFTQRPKPVPAPVSVASAAPAPVPAAPVPAAAPAPEAAPPVMAPDVPSPEETRPMAAPPRVRHLKPARQPLPSARVAVASRSEEPHDAATVVAQNQPPAGPAGAPPIQEPVAPPMTVDPPSAPAETAAPATETVEPQAAPQPAPSVTLQTGMTLPVRLGESLSSEHNQAGDTFTATLDAPLSAGGYVIAEKGAHLEGRVVEAQKSARVKGQAVLALELTKLTTSDGQHVEIKTETLRKQSETMATGDQVGIVAAAAGIGAIIGAMAGGGKGAAIGAGAGGAAGGGGVVATRNKPVTLATESKLTFRLNAPVTVTERLER
jgi:hypothetical protein